MGNARSGFFDHFAGPLCRAFSWDIRRDLLWLKIIGRPLVPRSPRSCGWRGTQLGCRALTATACPDGFFRRTVGAHSAELSAKQAGKQAKTFALTLTIPDPAKAYRARHADRRPCPQPTNEHLGGTNEQDRLDSHFRVGPGNLRRTSADPHSSRAPSLLARCVATLSKANVGRRQRRSAVPPATP